MKRIKSIIFSPELEKTNLICNAQKLGIRCIKVIDVRSAIYVATGISAQNREPVLVVINSSNDSRSAFSGMTEAYYSNLPIALVTYGNCLDYSMEPNDVVKAHYKTSTEEELYRLLSTNRWPMHIEYLADDLPKEKLECDKVQNILAAYLANNYYLYFGQGIRVRNKAYKCKMVIGGMINSYDGALANVLGASLACTKEKYIGVFSEDEVIHDMNSLGNINVNDRLIFIVIANRKNAALIEFSKAQGFDVDIIFDDMLDEKDVDRVVKSKNKKMLFVIKESK